jgi:phenylalanine-4-hydroxylase
VSGPDSRVSLLIEMPDRPGALESALRVFSANGVNLTHIESRPARGDSFDFYVDCEGDEDDPAVVAVVKELKPLARKLLVLGRREVPWFPRHVSELDLIAERTLDAGVELESDHPGFKDTEYRARRRHIDGLARRHRHGQPVPRVAYTERETATWRTVYERLKPLHEAYACAAYLGAVRELEAECDYGPDTIPQGRDVSDFLSSRTGFSIRPVPGLLGAREFLAGLAFRVFFATQYVRHHSRPLYTPEPDVCHELIGHAPMFADPAFADLSQEIGLASLGAQDRDVERLARCYWYSVEFGLLREEGELKAYGAGLLSSFGELGHAFGTEPPRPTLSPWDPAVAAQQPYPITDYQPAYFVADSMHDARQRMRDYCRNLPRPFYARYVRATQRIWVDRAVRRQTS